MKKLRELMAIMAIMATAVAMTGCGSDDDDDDDGGAPAAGNAPGNVQNRTYFFTPGGGSTRSIVFAPGGNTYTVTAEGQTAESGTYSYTVSSNNNNQATLTLNETAPDAGEVQITILSFTSANSGTYQLTRTPAGGGTPTTETGSFGTTAPGPVDPIPTNTNDTNVVVPPPGDMTVVGRRVQIQYGQATGSPGELFTFNQGGTFTSDFEPGAGGTYTTTASGNNATVNITYTAPAHANGDTATFNLTRTTDNGGNFTGTTVYGGTSSGVSGPWSFAP